MSKGFCKKVQAAKTHKLKMGLYQKYGASMEDLRQFLPQRPYTYKIADNYVMTSTPLSNEQIEQMEQEMLQATSNQDI